MQLLWILPTLGYGLFLFFTTGQWFGLVFGGLSLVSLGLAQLFKGRAPNPAVNAPVHFGATKVALGNHKLPKWEWLWQPEAAERVYQNVSQQNRRHQANLKLGAKVAGGLQAGNINPDGLSLWAGFDGAEAVEFDLANCGAHAILVGPTGSGKSQLLSSLLVSACQGYSPQQLRLWLVDFKGGATLAPFAKTPWGHRMATDLDSTAGELISALRQELAERQQVVASLGHSRLQDIPLNSRPPIHLLVVDELQPLLLVPGVSAGLEDLAARGRSLGIHLIVAAQSLNGVPRALVSNLGLRISVGKPDPIDLAQLGVPRQVDPLNPAIEGWSTALYSEPSGAGSFTFPASGKISANLNKYLFEPQTQTKDWSKGVFATELVENPIKHFDFSIGF